MKKRILLILLALALVFAFASCEKAHVDNDNDGKCDTCGEVLSENPPACTTHTDSNSDGKCDTCGATVENGKEPEDESNSLLLIDDGTAKFKLVFESSFGSNMRKSIDNFKKDMKNAGIDIVAEADNVSEVTDVEVLVGTITNRGEKYVIDKYTLGEKGYIVKRIDSKIIVLGGSDKALEDAFEAFVEDYIGYKKGKAPQNLAVTDKDNIIEIQDNYRITSVSVNGVDLKGYNIVVLVNAGNKYFNDYKNAATTLQSLLYSKAGYWLPIEKVAGEKSIVIAAVEDADEDGFRVSVRDNSLFIECAYHNTFNNAYGNFIASNISVKQGDINFSSTFSYTEEVSVVRYKDFGAVANGLDNDFFAIKEAHDYANEGGQKVVADRGTYLITKTNGEKAYIKTDTDWTQAKFILDDRNIVDSDPERGGGIFVVAPETGATTYTPSSAGKPGQVITALNNSAKDNGGLIFKAGVAPTVDLDLGYPAMLVLYNDKKMQYIRYGGNANNGGAQHEIIIVDENGKCDPTTALLHDYAEITKIVVRRIDDKPVTIKGGEFTTRANQCMETYAYFSRGIGVCRPNTTVTGLKHYITDEGEHGNPYSSWLQAYDTYNVLFEDCILTGHRVYMGPGSVESTPQGTYDTGAGNACKVTWKNVIQSNFFHLDKNGNPTSTLSTVTNAAGWHCWGIMGSNYCKNLTYDGSKLTRLDAHCGTYNATIKDSHVAVVAMIGGGTLTIENSTIYDTFQAVVNLRNDYGSTWHGDVYMKDVTFKITQTKPRPVSLFEAFYYNHDFGYTTYLPQNVYVDNFVVDGPVADNTIYILSGPAAANDTINSPMQGFEPSKNIMVPFQTITIKNNKMGYNYLHPMEKSAAFTNTDMTIVTNEEE